MLRHSGKCLEGTLEILESSGFPNLGAQRKHLEGLWDYRLLGPIPEFLIQQGWVGETQESAFPTSTPLMSRADPGTML